MSVKSVLVLGAGSVSRPCVRYLLDKGHRVIVADLSEERLKRTLGGHPGGVAVVGDAVGDIGGLLCQYKPDVAVCLLPTVFLAQTAAQCVEYGVSMVGASYVNDALRELDAKARKKGLRILCEVGVDPGIDHMSAVSKIRDIQTAGGIVYGFRSLCGALPDMSSNTNPLGYKLSWAPASLIGASLRSARIMEEGAIIDLPGGETYRHYTFAEILGLGWFEAYPNADSLSYIDAYSLPGIKSIYRGTLRYPGWCDMITAMQGLRLFDEEKRDFGGYTYASFMREQAGGGDAPVLECVAKLLRLAPYSLVIRKLEWLGLFDNVAIPPECRSARDIVADLYSKKLVFSPGESDMVAMQHQFWVSYPRDGRREKITSTMIERSPVDGDSAIARTTGIPIGIASDLILKGEVKGEGVLIPTTADIYEPALGELEKEGFRFSERAEEL